MGLLLALLVRWRLGSPILFRQQRPEWRHPSGCWHSSYKAVLFDMDDTLYPERAFVLGGFAAAARWAEQALGIPEAQGTAELKELFTRGVRGDTFNCWLAGHGRASGDLVAELIRVYREHQPAIVTFPEVEPALQQLQRRDRLGLVSDGYLSVQQRKLAALGLQNYFDAVVFTDAWGRDAWKPSRRPFCLALQIVGVAVSQALYIGDNAARDFLGANQLGMQTIWLRQAGGEYAHVQPPSAAHAAGVIVENWDELRRLLE